MIEVVGDASVPPPELLTVTVCDDGFEPPAIPLKLRLVGDSEMADDDDEWVVSDDDAGDAQLDTKINKGRSSVRRRTHLIRCLG